MYKVHVGCSQWKDDSPASSMKEAREIIEAWQFSGFQEGDVKATEAWIENTDSGQKFFYDIENGEWK